MKPLSKTAIHRLILESCAASIPLKHIKNIKQSWTMNELIYCLEKVHYDSNVRIQINLTSGEYVPIDGSIPTFISSKIRSKKVRIHSIEIIEDIDESEPCSYLLIVEEIK